MSFILDALKKSDETRRAQAGSPNLLSPSHEFRTSKKRAPRLMFLSIGLVSMVALFGMLFWLFPHRAQTSFDLLSKFWGSTQVSSRVDGEGIGGQSDAHTPQKPAMVIAEVDLPITESEEAFKESETLIEGNNGLVPSSSFKAETEVADIEVTEESRGDKAALGLRSTESREASLSGNTALTETPDSSFEPSSTTEDSLWEPQKPEYLEMWELPQSTQEKLSNLTLTVHVFDVALASRFVLINGRRFTEDTQVGEGIWLVSIVPEGAVLEVDDYRVLLTR